MSKLRPISSVHVDIARFGYELAQVPDGELAGWVLRLHKCLALRDPSIHEYGAHLLAEVEEFRKAEIERKKAKHSAPSKDSEESAENSDSHHRSDQIRSDQNKKQEIRPDGPGADADVGERKKDEVWDAVASLFHFQPPHPKKEAIRIGAVVRDLKIMGATGETVRACYLIAKKAWNGGPPFSPEALVKWWREFQHAGVKKIDEREKAEKFKQENGYYPTWAKL